MGNLFSRSSIVTVPDRSVMVNIVQRIVDLEDKIKRGEQLTKVQELEKKELEKVARAMKKVQEKSVSRMPNLTYYDVNVRQLHDAE